MAAPASSGEDGGLRVSVLSPEHAVYEGPATHVVAPAWNGMVGILRGHAPLMALLGEGELRVENGRESLRFNLSGGFMQVQDDIVTIMSEHAAAV